MGAIDGQRRVELQALLDVLGAETEATAECNVRGAVRSRQMHPGIDQQNPKELGSRSIVVRSAESLQGPWAKSGFSHDLEVRPEWLPVPRPRWKREHDGIHLLGGKVDSLPPLARVGGPGRTSREFWNHRGFRHDDDVPLRLLDPVDHGRREPELFGANDDPHRVRLGQLFTNRFRSILRSIVDEQELVCPAALAQRFGNRGGDVRQILGRSNRSGRRSKPRAPVEHKS